MTIFIYLDELVSILDTFDQQILAKQTDHTPRNLFLFFKLNIHLNRKIWGHETN